MTEKQKMLEGQFYDPNDEELSKLRSKCSKLCLEYNQTTEEDKEIRNNILKELGINLGKNVFLRGPIYFDYGCFISIGENSYANFNLTILDVCPVNIGKNVFIGSSVSILTPLHPLKFEERNVFMSKKGYLTNYEYGKAITIEDDCWIGSNVSVLPGVTIGRGSVIGAGSVVTKNIPENSLAFGNPCKIIKKIEDAEKERSLSNLIIRDIREFEFDKALLFAWKVFLQFDSQNCNQLELDQFYHMIHNPQYKSEIHLIGAYINNELIGVAASRYEGSHLSFMFVDARYQGTGIVNKLFEVIVKDCKESKMTSYVLPYPLKIYEKIGFRKSGPEEIVNGVIFTPMEYIIEKGN